MKIVSFWHRVLDVISPRMCVMCGRRLSATEEVICNKCNYHLPRTDFAKDAYNNIMAKLFWGRLPIERASALFYYEAHSETANIIYQLKYKGHPEIGYIMGRMLAKEFMCYDFFDGIDGIVPVPLTKGRLRDRGYNQSEEIAKGISEITGRPIYNDVIKRTVFHDSQTRKNRWERNDNVEHVFAANKPIPTNIKHLLMVDDVVTTGATIVASSSKLVQSDDIKISVLSLGLTKR